MKVSLRSVLLWIFAFIFTAGIAIYQTMTGPTYEARGKAVIENQEIRYKLIRSSEQKDAEVSVKVPDSAIRGMVTYRRFNTKDEWTSVTMIRKGENLVAYLPKQPPAGKLEYRVFLMKGETQVLLSEKPTVIRFTGNVPRFILIPHIFILFFAMMMSTRTGLQAIARGKNTYLFAWITVVSLFIGGLILGPLVQFYAFGEYWTGWPFGKDLTDNKTLVAVIFWIIAVIRLYKKPDNRTWPIIASIMLLLVYLIPHSLFGSSLDYTSGKVMTGK
jgi:hypothetical protein